MRLGNSRRDPTQIRIESNKNRKGSGCEKLRQTHTSTQQARRGAGTRLFFSFLSSSWQQQPCPNSLDKGQRTGCGEREMLLVAHASSTR